jgi:hypothetical protein
MIETLHMALPMLAVEDGREAWSQFVSSVGRALEGNRALLPIAGLVLLGLLVVLADVKLASWIERRWRRRHRR